MRFQPKAMKVLSLSEVRTKLGTTFKILERTNEAVTITRHRRPFAIIVSKAEYDGWQETFEVLRDAELTKEIRNGIRALRRTRKRYTLEELFADRRSL